MNIFSKYTLRMLKKNRTRTIVTIIGIILSVAMFTAVTESIVSGQQYLQNSVKATIGAFHALKRDVTEEELKTFADKNAIEDTETLQYIGYAEIGSKNEYKPYLFIGGMSDSFSDLVAVQLTEGRMPQKADEIVLPNHLNTNGRVKHKLGDVLKLEVGERQGEEGITWGDSDFSPETSKLVNTKTKTYTVVGFCERPDRLIERTEHCGYTAFTLEEKDKIDSHYTAFFTVNDLAKAYKQFEESTEISFNGDLLAFMGIKGSNTLMNVVYSLGAILILIIMFGSVALIYNSFSISVSERTKQFGLLRSVGATKKQMVRTVLTEALMLCVVAVPIGLLSGCLGIGITFRALSDQFSMIVGDVLQTGGQVKMKLVLNGYALLAASAISVITALVSAYIPVKRAVKMPAIEAIRMSNDIKIKSKKLKTNKLTYKLFGFEVMLANKNFKRNKKKYRTTVISLAMSVILFISASSLTFYFNKSFEMDINTNSVDLYAQSSKDGARELMESLSEVNGVDKSTVVATEEENGFMLKGKDIPKEFAQVYYGDEDLSKTEYASLPMRRVFVKDEDFKRLCKENGIDPSAYFDKSNPMAVLEDYHVNEIFDSNSNKSKKFSKPYFDIKKYPAELDVTWFETMKNGAEFCKQIENGKAIYIKNDKFVKYNVEDCIIQKGIKVGAKLENLSPFYDNSAIFIYPESMAETVLSGKSKITHYHGYFYAEKHNEVFEGMLKITEDSTASSFVENYSENSDVINALITLVSVFSYGFITLISLIAAANVFNTISTNIMLRRRELAMLKSVGMSEKGFRKMLSLESLLYGIKSILFSLPISLVLTYGIYYAVSDSGYDMPFTLPYGNIAFALVSVFIVVFASMVYSVKKLKKYNTADELKNENI